MRNTSCPVATFSFCSIPFLDPDFSPTSVIPAIDRQRDRQPDTTHSNTTGQLAQKPCRLRALVFWMSVRPRRGYFQFY